MIVEMDFADHWKTRHLVALAGDECAIRCLIRFWSHCQARRRWQFAEMTPAKLKAICNWPHDAQAWWDAMLETFLEEKGTEIVAHDWDQVNATLVARWKGGDSTAKKWEAQPASNGNHPAKPPAKPPAQTGQKAGERVEKRGEDKKEGGESSPARAGGFAAGAAAAEEVLSYAEQQRILAELANKVFTRRVRAADWSNAQKITWLSDAQPITRVQMDALVWLYELPLGHRVLEKTQRRQSFEKLLECLCSEIDKALTLRSEFGGSAAKKKPAAPEPDNWREAYIALWGDRGEDMPPKFLQMTVTQQQSVRKKIRELHGDPIE